MQKENMRFPKFYKLSYFEFSRIKLTRNPNSKGT